MTKEEALKGLKKYGHIYGTMYGESFSTHGSKPKLIKIPDKSLLKERLGFVFVWGGPGPDFNCYEYSAYGNTWAFKKEDFEQ